MVESARDTRDRGVGFTIGAGLLTVGGALMMYLNPNNPLGGWGFAVAIVAGILAVMAAQLYW